jgi:hypothetical protein
MQEEQQQQQQLPKVLIVNISWRLSIFLDDCQLFHKFVNDKKLAIVNKYWLSPC